MKLLSVQTGQARRIKFGERSLLTAFHKQAVNGDVAVVPLGLLGDEQADLSVHGGLSKAVYAYPSEHYPYWQEARQNAGVSPFDDSLPHGAMGENLTLSGLVETQLWVGDRLKFANCTLTVTEPREPCFKFNAAMGFSGASEAMARSGFCGVYLSVDQPGSLRAGEAFELLPGRRSVSVLQLFNAKARKHFR